MPRQVETLEEKIAHLERANDELSDIVARHEREIVRQGRLLELLLTREAERESDAGGTLPVADAKPPHW